MLFDMTNIEYIELLWSDYVNGTDSFKKLTRVQKYNRDYYQNYKNKMTEESKEEYKRKMREYYNLNKEKLSKQNLDNYYKNKSKT